MWIRIKAGLVYVGKKDKPFAREGELVNLKRDVAEALVASGVAEKVDKKGGVEE